jgi:hypothetical protein
MTFRKLINRRTRVTEASIKIKFNYKVNIKSIYAIIQISGSIISDIGWNNCKKVSISVNDENPNQLIISKTNDDDIDGYVLSKIGIKSTRKVMFKVDNFYIENLKTKLALFEITDNGIFIKNLVENEK